MRRGASASAGGGRDELLGWFILTTGPVRQCIGRHPKPLWASSDALGVPPDGQCKPPDALGTPQYPVRTPSDALGEASDFVWEPPDALGTPADAVLAGECPVYGKSVTHLWTQEGQRPGLIPAWGNAPCDQRNESPSANGATHSP